MTDTKSKAGEPAFPPAIGVSPSGDVYQSGELFPGSAGLTKREYFAALAMQGLMKVYSSETGMGLILEANKKEIDITAEELIAKLARTHADELLAELAKGDEE